MLTKCSSSRAKHCSACLRRSDPVHPARGRRLGELTTGSSRCGKETRELGGVGGDASSLSQSTGPVPWCHPAHPPACWGTALHREMPIAFSSTEAQRSQVTSLTSHSKLVDHRSLAPPTLAVGRKCIDARPWAWHFLHPDLIGC